MAAATMNPYYNIEPKNFWQMKNKEQIRFYINTKIDEDDEVDKLKILLGTKRKESFAKLNFKTDKRATFLGKTTAFTFKTLPSLHTHTT